MQQVQCDGRAADGWVERHREDQEVPGNWHYGKPLEAHGQDAEIDEALAGCLANLAHGLSFLGESWRI